MELQTPLVCPVAVSQQGYVGNTAAMVEPKPGGCANHVSDVRSRPLHVACLQVWLTCTDQSSAHGFWEFYLVSTH